MAAIRAGIVYWAIVFAFGFLFGTVRTFLLVPRLGALGAVLVEAPAILTVSFLTCGFLLRRYSIPKRAFPRVVMGISAFACLMIAELGVAIFVFHRNPTEIVTFSLAGSVGFAAQIVFALMPLIQR